MILHINSLTQNIFVDSTRKKYFVKCYSYFNYLLTLLVVKRVYKCSSLNASTNQIENVLLKLNFFCSVATISDHYTTF